MEKEIRLDRYLADMGKGTRSELKSIIRKGRVFVNGIPEKKPERKIRLSSDQVTLDGTPVAYVSMEYYMLHKPAGVLSATEDSRYPTVLDLIQDKNRKDLFPVGRLDLDTEGLLLITNDGALAHRLLSPGRHVDKVYLARCLGSIPDDAVKRFADGLALSDGLVCLPAKLEILDRFSGDEGEIQTLVRLTIREGKFHQVKRMMEAVGCPVVFLKRLSMGPLVLDESLLPGQHRPLNQKELELLQAL